MSNKELVIIRSRFQPFTKFHTDTIRYALVNLKKSVALCIIRDYETVSRFYRTSPDVGSADLRHLPIFNPFNSWEISVQIQSRLQKDFPGENIPIIISPLKFSELITLLTLDNDKAVPHDLKKFMQKHECEEVVFERCEIKKTLGMIISNIPRDNMPSIYDFKWLFGMFDLEDSNDCAKVSEYLSKHPEQYKPPNLPVYKLNDIKIGLYGQFMLWTYIQFVEKYDCPENCSNFKVPLFVPKEFKDIIFLSTEKNNLEKNLKDYVNNNTEFQKYKEKVSNTLQILLNGFERIPVSEQQVLLNFNTFIQLANTSIKIVE